MIVSSTSSRQLLLLLFFLLQYDAHAANSRRRIVTRVVSEPEYDRSITTFDPSGRLLQVEYGMEAANRGSSVLVAILEEGCIYIVSEGDNNKVHRLDDHVFLVTTGLAGDARLLASQLRRVCQQYRLGYGEAPRVEDVAREASQFQHMLTRTGGARPLGCTGIVVGIDNGVSSVFRTDPGGTMEDCLYCAAGRRQDKIMAALGAAGLHGEDDETTTRPARHTTRATDNHHHRRRLFKILSDASGTADRKNQFEADMWIIRPSSKSRGSLQAARFAGIRQRTLSSSLVKIKEWMKEEDAGVDEAEKL